jgi:hypothetical protein
MPADSGHGHRLLPVAGGGREHEILLAGAGMRSHYPRGFCPLPFLTAYASQFILGHTSYFVLWLFDCARGDMALFNTCNQINLPFCTFVRASPRGC